MFERKFEFIVHHPLEVCEMRILNLQKSGCFPPMLNTIDSSAVSERYRGYSTIHLSQKFGFSKGNRVTVKMTVEEIDSDVCHILGEVSSTSPLGQLVFFVFIESCAIINWRTWSVIIPATAFFIIWNFLFAIQTVYIRNRLIKTLEKALNQPKKKKRA